MMDCKKALMESDGDFDKAIEYLRKKGAAASQKRSDRIAKEGLIIARAAPDRTKAVIVEVNCETDFVGKSDAFKLFANSVADTVLESEVNNVSDLLSKSSNNLTIQQLL